MDLRSSYAIARRCLAGLDRLEESGVPVNNVRADLSTLADRLESAMQAETLDRRQRALAVGREATDDNPHFNAG